MFHFTLNFNALLVEVFAVIHTGRNPEFWKERNLLFHRSAFQEQKVWYVEGAVVTDCLKTKVVRDITFGACVFYMYRKQLFIPNCCGIVETAQAHYT